MKTIPERNMSFMNYQMKKVYLKKWEAFRLQVMKEATELYGELSSLNLEQIKKYIKKEEKKWKCGLRDKKRNYNFSL